MKTLEGHKTFPYIAWTVVLSFSLFTYTLVSDIKESTAYLAEKTEETQKATDAFIAVKKEQTSKQLITKDQR